MDDAMDSERVRRQINGLRFKWHEQVLRDPALHHHASAIRLAGHIMHRFHWQKGYAEISNASASKALGMPVRTVKYARQLLEKRCWIAKHETQRKTRVGAPWAGTRFTLSGGPDDLIICDPADSCDSLGEGT